MFTSGLSPKSFPPASVALVRRLGALESPVGNGVLRKQRSKDVNEDMLASVSRHESESAHSVRISCRHCKPLTRLSMHDGPSEHASDLISTLSSLDSLPKYAQSVISSSVELYVAVDENAPLRFRTSRSCRFESASATSFAWLCMAEPAEVKPPQGRQLASVRLKKTAPAEILMHLRSKEK